MKKTWSLPIIVLAFIFGFVENHNAQTFEFSATYGYQFGSKINFGGGNYLKLKDGGQFGISAGLEMTADLFGEVSYMNYTSELRLRDILINPGEIRLADVSVDWIQLGATQYFGEDKIAPFFGGGLGMVFFSPKNESPQATNGNLSSGENFFFAFKGGVNFMFTKSIGFKLQGNLQIPVQWGGVYVSAGLGGLGTGVAVRSTTVVGGISGGLVFRFGQD